jgi:competence protein ComEA
MSRSPFYGILIVVSLTAIIIAGGVMLVQGRPWAAQPMELAIAAPASASQAAMETYVGGEVAHPGWYPVDSGDSIGDALAMAGGITGDADTANLKLHVPAAGESDAPQLISINRADAWLLDALPGIGPSLAQSIIDYREANGTFFMTEELKLVPGIGESTYDGLKDFITVE